MNSLLQFHKQALDYVAEAIRRTVRDLPYYCPTCNRSYDYDEVRITDRSTPEADGWAVYCLVHPDELLDED